jgi:hypothetical protein
MRLEVRSESHNYDISPLTPPADRVVDGIELRLFVESLSSPGRRVPLTLIRRTSLT